ncbi:MAG TPA: hypothetical protein VIU35_19100 [Chitinophagaceae bacterium]
MKRILLQLFIVPAIILGIGSCSDKGGGATSEASLTVTLNPPVNSFQSAAPQTDFPLTVSISSTMPSQGVTIDVVVKKDDGSGATVFTANNPGTTSANTNFTITGTPIGVVCVTTVTVTSKTQATNTWTGSYRYSRKA